MFNETSKPERPIARVGFARITGSDDQGNDIVGSTREVGAIWPRKNGKKGGILRFDHIPVELTHHQGVVFVIPIDDKDETGAGE